MTRGQGIVAEARKRLADFITFEVQMLYKKFGWEFDEEEDEDYIIETADLGEPIYVNVEVDNSNLDVEDIVYEQREVCEVIVNVESGIWFNLYSDEAQELTIDEVSIEELAHIADVLESAYDKK